MENQLGMAVEVMSNQLCEVWTTTIGALTGKKEQENLAVPTMDWDRVDQDAQSVEQRDPIISVRDNFSDSS